MNFLYEKAGRSIAPVFHIVQIVNLVEYEKRSCNNKNSFRLALWKEHILDYSRPAFSYKFSYLRSFCSDLQMLIIRMHEEPWKINPGELDTLVERFLVMDKVSEIKPIL